MPDQKNELPPKTRTDNVSDTIHGVTVADPYRWLEDQNNPDVQNWISKQNKYTQAILGSLPEKDFIHRRIEELLKVETISPPCSRGGRYFFFKRYAYQDQSVIYMRNNSNGKDETLIDCNNLSKDRTISVTILNISNDGKLLAYGLRDGGEDYVEVKLFDVDRQEHISDCLPKGVYLSLSFRTDNEGVYYSNLTKEGSRVYYHRIGSVWSDDIELFKGNDRVQRIFTDISADGRYLMLSVVHGSSANKVEIYLQDIKHCGEIIPIISGIAANFSGRIEDGYLYLRTNWQAPNGRIIKIDLSNYPIEYWQEIIPETNLAMTEFSLIGGKIFVHYLENANSCIKIFDISGEYIRNIIFPCPGTADGIWGSWEDDEAFYIFNSFAWPKTIYRYLVSTGEQEIWEQVSVPIKSNQIEVKQVWYESKDKTRVPMFLVYKSDVKFDGSLPTLLTGYGGFRISLTPTFSARAILWVENGGVFAVPSLRGGGEFGEEWHRAGILNKKQNTFDDFIAAAEWLIENGYTNPEKLAIYGNSNGGLLVGAAITQRPQLFKAVICSYPLLDMIRYHRFLYTHYWVLEYGSSEDLNQFNYLYKYSPYHCVKQGVDYPAVLFITGDADTRVAPLHALKMTATMQLATGSNNPILLSYQAKTGHAGGQPIVKQIEGLSNEISFLFWQLGIKGISN